MGTSNDGGGDEADELAPLLERLRDHPSDDIIERFDVEFDVPMQQLRAVNLLRLQNAYDEVDDPADLRALAIRVGAHWCTIVTADVELDLVSGRQHIAASRADATALAGRLARGAPAFERYAAARWFDGTGRIEYRMGNFAAARRSFETARSIADDGLWWCVSDIASNVERARLEEDRQAAGSASRDRVERTVVRLAELAAHTRPDEPDDADAAPRGRHARESARGRANLLHNRAVALLELAKASTDDERTELLAASAESSSESEAIARALGDHYRLAQALSHQAILALEGADLALAVERFTTVQDELRWRRGSRIATQHIARITGGAAGARLLVALDDQVTAEASRAGGAFTGLDLDLRRYTVRALIDVAAAAASEPDHDPSLDEILAEGRRREHELGRSVRRVIALPQHKRAYSAAVQPMYERLIGEELTAEGGGRPLVERTLALVEESTVRELMDLIASADLPLLGPPDDDDADTASGRSDGTGTRRRRPLVSRREDGSADADAALAVRIERREAEFEEQFLAHPLEAAPDDPEIGFQTGLLLTNLADTCLVRFFTYVVAGSDDRRLAAWVLAPGSAQLIELGAYRRASELVAGLEVDRAPDLAQCQQIWETLLDPLWAAVEGTGRTGNLVIIPCGALFAVPFQLALEPGTTEPLGARRALSQSVSLGAFVGRSRHLLRRHAIQVDDDLSALAVTDDDATGSELLWSGWPTERLHLAGTVDGLTAGHQADPDWDGLRSIIEVAPEFFVYAGHGGRIPHRPELGPFLFMGDGAPLTPYDIALRVRLPRNRLTILGACLAGQGADTGGGDVAGFLRAFMAAGSGAIALPLWSVLDDAIGQAGASLLSTARSCGEAGETLDLVSTLHAFNRAMVDEHPGHWNEWLPLALYT